MKYKIMMMVASTMALLITFSVKAYVTLGFPGWDALTKMSPDIVIVHCTNAPDPFNIWENGHQVDLRGPMNSDVEIVSVLKGTTNSGTVQMASTYWPKKGQYYLLFADYHDGIYQATEDYRVLPLGAPFTARHIVGLPLKEQLKILFGYADITLDVEIRKEQEQKSRIEQAFKK